MMKKVKSKITKTKGNKINICFHDKKHFGKILDKDKIFNVKVGFDKEIFGLTIRVEIYTIGSGDWEVMEASFPYRPESGCNVNSSVIHLNLKSSTYDNSEINVLTEVTDNDNDYYDVELNTLLKPQEIKEFIDLMKKGETKNTLFKILK
jgi:hypothetical protein